MITKKEIMERICHLEDAFSILEDEIKELNKPKKTAKKTTKKTTKK